MPKLYAECVANPCAFVTHLLTPHRCCCPPPPLRDLSCRLQLEDVCAPIVSKLYAESGGAGGEAGSDDDLGDHDEL
jgi:hypothetical protein